MTLVRASPAVLSYAFFCCQDFPCRTPYVFLAYLLTPTISGGYFQMVSPVSSLLLLVLLPQQLVARPQGGELLSTLNPEATEDYEVRVPAPVKY